MNIDLSDVSLSPRWRKKFIGSKIHLIKWDVGIEKGNEWIYASINNADERGVLINWLNTKSPPITGPAVEFSQDYTYLKSITLNDNIIQRFVAATGRIFIHVNMEWIFEFRNENIARFGRWVH